jgi:hypothetical protein
MPSSVLGTIGFGLEATKGADTAPSIWVAPISMGLAVTNEWYRGSKIVGLQDAPRKPVLARRMVGGSVGFELTPSFGQTILQAFLKREVTTDKPLKTVCAEVGYDPLASEIECIRYQGLMAKTIKFSCAEGGPVECTVDFVGQTYTKKTSVAAVTLPAKDPWMFHEALIEMNTGAAYAETPFVRSFEITIEQGTKLNWYVDAASPPVGSQWTVGNREVSVKVDMHPLDEANGRLLTEMARAGGSSAFKATFTKGSDILILEVPTAKMLAGDPSLSGDDQVASSFDLFGVYTVANTAAVAVTFCGTLSS